MKKPIALISTFVLFPIVLAGKIETDVKQERSYYDSSVVIDHLEPLSRPGFAEQYNSLAEFRCSPAVEILSRIDFEPWILVLALAKDKQSAELRIFEGNLWPREERGAPKVSVSIDLEKAAVIYDVWANVILETKYPKTPSGGLHGISYYFSTWIRGWGTIEGQTWSPEDDAPPKWMVDLAWNLKKWAEAKPKKRDAIWREVEQVSEKILDYLTDKENQD